VAILLPIPVYWICNPDGKKQRQTFVEEQWVDEEASGLSGVSERPEAEGEASSGDPAANIETVGREMLQKVLEANDEETREMVTPRFLEDLDYNRAIIKGSDLTQLKFERQGRYWVQGNTPYELPPRVEGDQGKAGMAQLRMVFMEGRWKLHDLNLR